MKHTIVDPGIITLVCARTGDELDGPFSDELLDYVAQYPNAYVWKDPEGTWQLLTDYTAAEVYAGDYQVILAWVDEPASDEEYGFEPRKDLGVRGRV